LHSFPFSTQGEKQKLEAMPETNDLIKNAKVHQDGGIALLRLDERADTTAAINRLRPKFKVLFDTDEPFETIVEIKHEIYVAAQMLAIGAGKKDLGSAKVIWGGSAEDKISERLQRAVDEVEKLCAPVLKGDSQ